MAIPKNKNINFCCKRNIWIDILLISIPSLVLIGLVCFLLRGTTNIALTYILEPNIEQYLTYTEYQNLMKLMDKGVVLSADDIITNLVSYYNILITILLAMLAIVTVVVIYINKQKTEETINELVKDRVQNEHKIYINSIDFSDIVDDSTKYNLDRTMNLMYIPNKDFVDHKEYLKLQISVLEKRVLELEGNTNGNN